jgi:predicted RND superfamily exporter protein
MRSVVLAAFSILLIALSFSVTQVIYSGVFQIEYFASLHALVIFVVLGISADNVFVLFDAWQQSRAIEEYEGNLRRRIAFTFKRAGKALAVTACTAAAAFFSNCFNSIMPIRAFGIYAGIIVLVNYVIILILMPPMIVFHEKYLANRCFSKKESSG